MTARFSARTLPDSEYQQWNDFVAGCPEGSVYSDARYLEVLCAATGGNFRIAAVHAEGRILGGIALYIEQDRGMTVVSPRYLLFYNGFVVSQNLYNGPSRPSSKLVRLHSALLEYLEAENFDRVYIKTRPPRFDFRVFFSEGWLVEPCYSYTIDLADIDAAWASMDRNLRRLVKRGEKRGLQLTSDHDFESFWALHVQTSERKGAPIYLPKDAYRQYVAALHDKDLCRLYQARQPDGSVAATLLVLTGPHRTCHSVCAGIDWDARDSGASAFLRWASFKDLSARGYTGNDLTGANLNPVTRFKSQLGGELTLALELHRTDHAALRRRSQIAHFKEDLRGWLTRRHRKRNL